MATHAPDRRRRLLRRGIAALLSWLGLLLVTAGPALQGHAQSPTDPTIVTFGYTGGAQTWTVPPNVTQVAIGVFGAQGGGFPDQPGGLGGEASAGIPVTPGDTITVMVGGAGAVLGGCGDSPGAGGFNGGGAGGRAAGCPGAGGGGATDVRIGGAGLEHRVLVAGGGGAVGIGRDSSCRADGGAGGGLTGGTGACGGGSGGNQTGTSGSGQRGIGGAGAADTFNGGGGGGGGYYGGAGGSSALGGGGGSGFGPAGTSFRSGVRQGDGFAEIIYFPGPVVTSISPNSGPQAGGTAVTITGTYLSNPVGVTEVAFGSSPAANVSCASTTQCTATSPPGVGTVSVRVSLLGQTSADTPADNFTYQAPSPSLSDVSPNTGPPAGGTLVTITGTGFDLTPGATIVWFGDTPATDVHCTSTMQCTAKSPPGSGIVYVGVQTPGGTTARAAFGYLAPPTVAGISPSAGPMPGGTVVTITGANLSWTYADTTVAFGNSPATNVFCASDARCTATSPAGTGTVSVRVTVGGQQSADTPADDFTYTTAPPTVTGLSPSQGPAAGGTTVTITGTGFSPAASAGRSAPAGGVSVAFGSAPATGVSCRSSTQCTATSPAGMGMVHVHVTVGGQTSPDTPADDFTYTVTPPPTVIGLSPNAGPAAGGTAVTITGTGFSPTRGGTSVAFGGVTATSVTCASATSCTATSPPGMGTVSVRVTVGGQTSADTSADDFTYVPAGSPGPPPGRR